MKRMMMAVGVLLSTAAVASMARAQDGAAPASAGASASMSGGGAVAPSGLQLGLRLGYAIPAGDAAENEALSDVFSGGVPIIVDVGYRIDPHIYLGVYGQYGILFVKDQNGLCDNGVSCSGSDVRVGVNAHYHISPDQSFDPWLGIGIGYEWAALHVSGSTLGETIDSSNTEKGLEFVNLQVGGDYHVSPQFGIGPFLSFSFGQYSSASTSISYSPPIPGQANIDTSSDIQNKAMHEWLTIGVRGVYNL